MKVLHVIVGLGVGGAELMLERLVRFDAGGPRKHQVVSLTGLQTVGQRMLADGISVRALGVTRPWHVPCAFIRLYRLIHREKPDVVQTWMYHADLMGGLAARLAGCRNVVWNLRTNALPRSAFPLRTRLLQRVCAVVARIVPTRIIAASFGGLSSHEAIGYPAARMLTIANGFAVPAQDQLDAARLRLRQQWGLGPDECAIGMVGRFDAQKGHEYFVRAIGAVVGALPQTTFFLFGRGCDDKNQVLQGWIDDAGVRSCVRLMGERRDISDCLAALDVFCLPSLVEGFPNALGEAMAAGNACVSTRAGGAAELLAGHGLLVPIADAVALADALTKLARAPAAERAALGQAARRHVAGSFKMERTLFQYSGLYETLVRRTLQKD